jgi:hypothetical protein
MLDIAEYAWNQIEKKTTKTNLDVSTLLSHMNLIRIQISIFIIYRIRILDNSDSISIFPSLGVLDKDFLCYRISLF